MATNVTYTSLFNDVTAYLERGQSVITDDTVFNQIPRLINAAERKIMQFLKLQGTLIPLVAAVGDEQSLRTGVPVITKPDGWRQTVSFFYGAGSDKNVRTPLFARGYEYCRAYWPDDSITDPANPPCFYADYDYQHWLITPTPDNDYPVEINCYMQPTLLDEQNQTNFFSEYTPNMLLYGALLEAAPFLKDDARLQVWQNLWTLELQSLNTQDMQKIMDRASDRRSA